MHMIRKLDIFKLINRYLDKNEHAVYKTLTEDEKKEFSPFMIMEWMRSTNNKLQLMLVNEFLNQYVFSLAKHPDLLSGIIEATTIKGPCRFSWYKSKSYKNHKMISNVVSTYYNISERESEYYLPFINADDLYSIAEYLGLSDDNMKKLKLEIKHL